MREILVLLQIVSGLAAGVALTVGLQVFRDAGLLGSMLAQFSPNTQIGIGIALFLISLGLWHATRRS